MTDTIHQTDFPFDQLAIFPSWVKAAEAGYPDDQIWSVCVHEDTWVYGPPRHYVNHVYHIVTAEKHDDQTYYEESEDENHPQALHHSSPCQGENRSREF